MHVIDLLIKECSVYVFKILFDQFPDPMHSIEMHVLGKNTGNGLR